MSGPAELPVATVVLALGLFDVTADVPTGLVVLQERLMLQLLAPAGIVHDEDDSTYRMDRRITLGGPLSQQQKDDLLRVANACPLHKALHKKFEITTALD